MYSCYFVFEILKNKNETAANTGAIKNVNRYPYVVALLAAIELIPKITDNIAPTRKGKPKRAPSICLRKSL